MEAEGQNPAINCNCRGGESLQQWWRADPVRKKHRGRSRDFGKKEGRQRLLQNRGIRHWRENQWSPRVGCVWIQPTGQEVISHCRHVRKMRDAAIFKLTNVNFEGFRSDHSGKTLQSCRIRGYLAGEGNLRRQQCSFHIFTKFSLATLNTLRAVDGHSWTNCPSVNHKSRDPSLVRRANLAMW